VDKDTGISFVGDDSWTVTFTGGTYKFHCDAHPTTMKGTLTVS